MYPVGEGVPDAAELLGAGVSRWVDRVSIDDERVEVDHGDVVVEKVEDSGAGNACGQGRDSREDGPFRHGIADSYLFWISV